MWSYYFPLRKGGLTDISQSEDRLIADIHIQGDT